MLDLKLLLYYNVCMKNLVREPRQERSIEKKNRIIDAGYELFSEVGYYGTNTAEIAKKAGVPEWSTCLFCVIRRRFDWF